MAESAKRVEEDRNFCEAFISQLDVISVRLAITMAEVEARWNGLRRCTALRAYEAEIALQLYDLFEFYVATLPSSAAGWEHTVDQI